jgi:ATP-dependent helicase/nuclease subunit A
VALTLEQATAVGERTASIVLASGAGCGKTHVLTARYVSHLANDGVRVGQVLAITFTDRAARQMRQRVRQALTHRAADDPTWADHLRDLDNAPITTIHAFCGNLLRQYALAARLDPGFTVVEEVLAQHLRATAQTDALQALLTADTPTGTDLRHLVLLYGWPSVTDTVSELLYENDPAAWAHWLAQPIDAIASAWEQRRATLLPAFVTHWLRAEPKVAGLLHLLRKTPCHGPHTWANVRRLLDELPALGTYAGQPTRLAQALDELHEAAKVGKERANAWPDAATYERVKDALADFRGHFKAAFALFTTSAADLVPTVTVAQQWLRVAQSVNATYAEHKRRAAVVDFGDLLTLARDLLRDQAEVRRAVQERFRHVLIDELQDTDPVQMELVAHLTGDGLHAGKLFAVGDAQQSIYRFRGADVSLFTGLRAQVPSAGQLGLTRNFRSQPGILDVVNTLFRTHLPGFVPLVAHHPARSADPCVEFLWTTTADLNAPGDAGQPADSVSARRRAEAAALAQRLVELLAQSPDPTQPIRPGDIVLLFRSMSQVAIYESALQRAGLDYYLVGGRAFFAQQEVFDLLHLLRTLDNPYDTLSLVGVLRSPFVGLSDEALVILHAHSAGLWAGLHERQALLPADQQAVAAWAAQFLDHWRAQKDRLPLGELVAGLIAASGYDAALQFEFLAERKLANLWKLTDLARTFDRAGRAGLAEFTARLGDLVARQPREEQAATQPENADVIRIMSIHQAKGLEFPVVVVPDLSATRFGGRSAAARWDRELGCLPRLPSDADEEAPPFSTVPWLLGQTCERLADYQEELRVFYVACTRAERYLILSAYVTDPPVGWLAALAECFDLTTGLPVEPGLAGAARVVWATPTAPPPADSAPPAEPTPLAAALPVPARTEVANVVVPFVCLTTTGPWLPADEWRPLRTAWLPATDLGRAQAVFWDVVRRWPLADADAWPLLLADAVGLSERWLPIVRGWLEAFAGSVPRTELVQAAECVHDEEYLLDASDVGLPILHGVLDWRWRDADDAWHVLAVDLSVESKPPRDPWRGHKPALFAQARLLRSQLHTWPATLTLLALPSGAVVRTEATRYRAAAGPVWAKLRQAWSASTAAGARPHHRDV